MLISALFGLKMLKEGFEMRADEGMEELDEVQQELKQKDEERERQQGDAESGPVRASDKLKKCVSPVFFQGIFRVLTTFAETIFQLLQ